MALDAITTRVQPIERIAAVTADADDNRILECAVAAGSEWHSPRETPPKNLGTTWEQLRPSTGENGGSGPTSKQDESTS
jgi:hypothetical protein